MTVLRWLLGITLAVLLIPVALPIIAGLTANLLACDLDEGSIHPCLIGSADIGKTLYAMAMFGWFAIGTLPLAAITIVAWIVVEVGVFIGRRYRASRTAPDQNSSSPRRRTSSGKSR